MNLAILLLPLLFFFAVTIQSSFSANNDQHYFEVTRPLPTDAISPACSGVGVDYSFRNTSEVTVDFIPPPETCNWSHAVLEFRSECELGDQEYERIVGVWIDGVELLRTSTPQPRDGRIFWNVRKDVTRYTSIFRRDNNQPLSVMIENNVDYDFTGGVYHVNISFLFYSDNDVNVRVPSDRVLNLLNPNYEPADLIIPIPRAVDEGCWFRIQNETDVLTKNVRISPKTYKAVLELYVSSHGDDGFWYINPSDSYIEANNLTTTQGAHGGYREVLVTIDGKLVGSVIPFPVIFSSGIHPLFWEPVVSIGAFDLPSYDIDLTAFLGFLSDNKPHSIGLQVADAISFWLVDANLHLWLDHNSNVKSQILEYKVPSMDVRRQNQFKMLDGIFNLDGERESKAKALINSSFGNLKIKHTFKTKFKSRLKIKDQGARTELDQWIKMKNKITITEVNGRKSNQSLEIRKIYPLKINIVFVLGSIPHTNMIKRTVVQGRSETVVDGGKDARVLNQNQNCSCSMVIKEVGVESGPVDSHQKYFYKDGFGCYSRKVDVADCDVVADVASSVCA